MALNDIVVWKSPDGGANFRTWYELGGSQSFVRGEPVGIDASAGQVLECPTDGTNPAMAELLGIADGPVSYTKNGTTVTTNPQTGTDYAQGDLLPVVLPKPGLFFATENFTTNGSAFNNAAPTQAMIGDEAGLVHISGDWGIEHGTIDTNASTCRIVDVVERTAPQGSMQGVSNTVFTPATTGSGNYIVVFEIVAHMNAQAEAATPVL